MSWPRGVQPGPHFALWRRFAAERHAILLRRLAGAPPPWTADPILRSWRFTNAFRVADRVSQALLREALAGVREPRDAFVRAAVFRTFNRPETWRLLLARLGPPEPTGAWLDAAAAALDEALAAGERVFSGAYVMPAGAGALRHPRKHRNWLRLIGAMLDRGLPEQIAASPERGFGLLRAFPMMGDFLAYQWITDLGYAWPFRVEEARVVAVGPGARRGLARCFPGGPEAEIVRAIFEDQEALFAELDLPCPRLRGRRLQPIDVQNLFCELDKYARVALPQQRLGPARIKRRFAPAGPLPPLAWPERWEAA